MYASQKNLIVGLERPITTLAGVDGKKAMIFIGAEPCRQPGNGALPAALRGVAQHANANGVTMYMVDAVDRPRRGNPTERMVDASAVIA
ncbi:MAG TPA: hypothetical protein VGQ76_19640 [Thermoanaerobaculia bacterium]|nr:hypothetical protein [Thermoanaerobaculia bacterium]